MRSTNNVEDSESESETQRLESDKVKFENSLKLLQNSLINIIDTSKCNAFKCHILAKLNMSQMTPEEKITSLFKKTKSQKENQSLITNFTRKRKIEKMTEDEFDNLEVDTSKDYFENLKNEPMFLIDLHNNEDNFNSLLDYVDQESTLNIANSKDFRDSDLDETNNLTPIFGNNKDFDSLA